MQTQQKTNLNDENLYYVASEVKAQLLKGKKKVLEADQDRIYVVTGREGLGKSTLTMQLAATIDPNFNLDNIVFTPEQFAEKIKKAKRGTAIIYDEGFSGLSSKSSISRENKKLVQLLMECRQLNLFIFIVLPSFFLLEKYVALFRSTALFNVLSSKKNFKLRFYKIYNYDTKKKLYILGKNLMDYSRPKIVKSYRFYGKLPPSINEKEYRAKKLKAFRGRETEEGEESRAIKQRNHLFYLLHKEYGLKYTQISNYLEKCGVQLDSTNVGRYIRHVSKKMQNVDVLL